MSIGLESNFIAFQACLAQAASSLAVEEAASALLEIQALPEWRFQDLKPSTLMDLARGKPSLACWFDTSLGLTVCRILGVDPLAAYQREVRSDRILPVRGVFSEVLQMDDMEDQTAMARQMADLMKRQGALMLSGIFHVVYQRLYVGSNEIGHLGIAMHAKIWDESEYTRVTFGMRDGHLKAVWPVSHDNENVSARKMIERLLSRIFDGIPIPE